MTGKETRSVSLDPDIDSFLADHDNASTLVNDLVDEYRTHGDRGTAGLRLQLKQKKRELDTAKAEVERLETDVEELETVIAGREKRKDAKIDEAREVLRDVEKDPENPGIKNWAEKLGLRPEELIELL